MFELAVRSTIQVHALSGFGIFYLWKQRSFMGLIAVFRIETAWFWKCPIETKVGQGKFSCRVRELSLKYHIGEIQKLDAFTVS